MMRTRSEDEGTETGDVSASPRLRVSPSPPPRISASPPTLRVTLLLVFCLFGCGKTDTSTSVSSTRTSEAEVKASPQSAFERDLRFVRNGQFSYVWIFSRKDGRPLDKDDAAYLRKNAPQVVDWVTTDEGKRVIAGTNFNLEQGNLNLLRKRFVVEDYSGK